MHRFNLATIVAALSVLSFGCAEAPIQPDLIAHGGGQQWALSAADGVRVSEIHYDNDGTDTGEAIEIAGPAGTDLTGWSVVLYNGSATVRAP